MLEKAIEFIEQSIGSVVARSTFFETDPWGFDSSNRFMNACISVKTQRSPLGCLMGLKEIERGMGRLKSGKNGYADRLIDIDILLFDDQVIKTPDLIVPHPHLQDRKFVLEPLSEIAPEFVHPVLKETIRSLFEKINVTP